MIKRLISGVILAIISLVVLSNPAFAIRSQVITTDSLGNDVSYPQCRAALPINQSFGIVGVNDGLATVTNRCLVTQLLWASHSRSLNRLARPGLYLNTANPGGLSTSSWPSKSNSLSKYSVADPYGNCDASDSLACAWLYGWNRALGDVQSRFMPAAKMAGVDAVPARYIWWLDAETSNTWESGSTTALKSNAADLEGMTAYLKSLGANVGLYSTTAQWRHIVGHIGINSNLNGLANWRPGGADLAAAKQACTAQPLTLGGHIVLTQYIANDLDYDYAC